MNDGKVGFNTIKYTTAFLYRDWLYFLWHGSSLAHLAPISKVCTDND